MLTFVLAAFAASAHGATTTPTLTSVTTIPISSVTQTAVSSVTQTAVSSVTQTAVSTAIASASIPLSSPLPSQIAVPPKQAWCPSEIFCAGALLQSVNVAGLYVDPKTFVDKPTNVTSSAVLSAFSNLTAQSTEGDIEQFVDTFFRGEGQELEALPLENFNQTPAFLTKITDPLVKAFSQTVHGFWGQLIRGTNSSTLCNGSSCESSLIPLNHTFVVPGGRFREQYYWDSFWIVEGLLESELFDIAKATLQNFMDELTRFGFIPNGGRIYYLNRSQPPLFIQMLARYVQASNDTSILAIALPLAEKELNWWQTNRMLNVTSPFSNKTFTMAHYAVNNSAPRPESYLTDYNTANNPALTPALNLTQRSALYAELASGAETGWDYSSRWLQPNTSTLDTSRTSADLTTLNVRGTIGVDLNSILYKNHILMAQLYGTSNPSAAARHRAAAASLRAGILDLFWDATKLAFYDFNLKTNARNDVFSVATFYPLWSGIIPDELLRGGLNTANANANTTGNAAFGFFASVNMVMNRYNGTFPTTFIDTGLQWDAPNAWPPHQYIVLSALRALPSNITSGPTLSPVAGANTFSLVPAGQLGLAESGLPTQPVGPGRNATTPDLNALTGPNVTGDVVNGGTAKEGEGWAEALQRQLANRYVASVLCSWHATGGSIPDLLPRLSDDELNVTQSVTNNGNMFEKFSTLDIDSAGRGGEYTVQAGFGWTNGVLLWVASNYGDVLVKPVCPDLVGAGAATGTTGGGGGTGTGGTTGGGGGDGGNSTTGQGGEGTNAGGKVRLEVRLVVAFYAVVAYLAL
ncbi:glycoside hydrolase family 37 protein [Mycena floridula]|nr:glycoside hydrolase family 37 protein [Mycena floridula]